MPAFLPGTKGGSSPFERSTMLHAALIVLSVLSGIYALLFTMAALDPTSQGRPDPMHSEG